MGGIGLELADWLVLRGARKLVLSSRTGVRTGYQSRRLRLWCSYGVTVVISLADVTTECGVTDLLSNANKLGQVDAIFNLAMVSVMLVFVHEVSDSYIMLNILLYCIQQLISMICCMNVIITGC